MTIEKLSVKHFLDCADMVVDKTKIAGTNPPNVSVLFKGLEKYFLSDINYHVFGFFDNTKLESFITISLQETIARGKFWLITNFYSSNTSNFFTFDKKHFGDLVRVVIDFAENLGYNKFYYCISEKIDKVYEKQWAKNTRSRNYNYNLETVAVIPPNTIPDDKVYWKLMGEDLKKDTMIIKYRQKHE